MKLRWNRLLFTKGTIIFIALLFAGASLALPSSDGSEHSSSASSESGSDDRNSDEETPEEDDDADDNENKEDAGDAALPAGAENDAAVDIAEEMQELAIDPYQRLVRVSQRFLKGDKHQFVSEKAHRGLNWFKSMYDDKKGCGIDITNLSARVRIYLLNEIIKYKIAKLPPGYYCQTYDEFKLLAMEDEYWKKRKTKEGESGVVEFEDKVPVEFKIGTFKYSLSLGPTFHQIGSGKVWGLRLYPNGQPSADKHDDIGKLLKTYNQQHLKRLSALLLQQKRDGKPITTEEENNNRFLNGLNLLLDYEVARRLVDKDTYMDLPADKDNYKNLPVVAFLPCLCDLENFDRLVVGIVDPLDTYRQKISLLQGKKREQVAKEFADSHADYVRSPKVIREKLRCLHADDEDSGDEYEGREESVIEYLRGKIATFFAAYNFPQQSTVVPKNLAQQRNSFLDGVTDRYIEGMCHIGGEVLWVVIWSLGRWWS